mmetsp:Transcript_87093/g.186732  ORF Transcript_87093/g.186732 Transcript_87093/m.186732 type:complete len:273 (+) Transcript_87093:260-1078(+)
MSGPVLWTARIVRVALAVGARAEEREVSQVGAGRSLDHTLLYLADLRGSEHHALSFVLHRITLAPAEFVQFMVCLCVRVILEDQGRDREGPDPTGDIELRFLHVRAPPQRTNGVPDLVKVRLCARQGLALLLERRNVVAQLAFCGVRILEAGLETILKLLQLVGERERVLLSLCVDGVLPALVFRLDAVGASGGVRQCLVLGHQARHLHIGANVSALQVDAMVAAVGRSGSGILEAVRHYGEAPVVASEPHGPIVPSVHLGALDDGVGAIPR